MQLVLVKKLMNGQMNGTRVPGREIRKIYHKTVLMEGNYRSLNHTTQPSRPATEFRMLWWHGNTRFMSIARENNKLSINLNESNPILITPIMPHITKHPSHMHTSLMLNHMIKNTFIRSLSNPPPGDSVGKARTLWATLLTLEVLGVTYVSPPPQQKFIHQWSIVWFNKRWYISRRFSGNLLHRTSNSAFHWAVVAICGYIRYVPSRYCSGGRRFLVLLLKG